MPLSSLIKKQNYKAHVVKKYRRRHKSGVVLVCVLKDRRDLDILLTKGWYRIPVEYMPKRKFKYLAFYQPSGFSHQGQRILYYARVLGRRQVRRKDILPQESNHPRADQYYFKFRVGTVLKLSRPVLNLSPRRISFGFTTLSRLLNSKNILQLYKVAPTEQILENAFKRYGIIAHPQYFVRSGSKRFFVDFAIFCRHGKIAVECDNKKAHAGKSRGAKDKIKNAALRRCGWKVMRLTEKDIVSNLEDCMIKLNRMIRRRGGLKSVLAF